MHRTLLILILIIATATVSFAQSGRGRQLRIEKRLHPQTAIAIVPDAPEVSQPSPSKPIQIKSRMINHADDDGLYHMTRADKRAGWILLGVLVLGVYIMSQQE